MKALVKRNYCVIGYPISHSLSPKIHNVAFKKLKIQAVYKAIEVRPENLSKFFKDFGKKFAGCNVTIPHKINVIKYIDKIDKVSSTIGAVNTIVNTNGILMGFNTDVTGAMNAITHGIRAKKERLKNMKMIVIGAGGAARAIIYGLKMAGAKVKILNRTVEHARKLAQEFHCEYGDLLEFADCISTGRYRLIVNATSVGMHPKIKQTPVPNLYSLVRRLKRKPIVMDIVYRPRMTKFLRNAKAAGCKIITGDNMFLEQAKKSFELWTGIA